jgi:hypothetical protein
MVSSTVAGVDLPPWRPSPSPPADKREPQPPSLSPHTARSPLPLHGRRAVLFLRRRRRATPAAPRRWTEPPRSPASPPSASPLPPPSRPLLRRAQGPRERRQHRRPEAPRRFSLIAGISVELSPPRSLDSVVVPEDLLFVAVDREDFVSNQGKSYHTLNMLNPNVVKIILFYYYCIAFITYIVYYCFY